MRTANNIIFLDIDGCLTSVESDTYFNPNPEKYHPLKTIIDSVLKLCKETDSRIILSTNWRKFDINGTYSVNGGTLNNPISEVRTLLGDFCIGTLPAVRHVNKSQALILWFEKNSIPANFVIFDDDVRENFQNTSDYDISSNFILIDKNVGISNADIKKAKCILSVNKV